jgi:1-acyl-sn-glycerol-3-phosphate acyltransferase
MSAVQFDGEARMRTLYWVEYNVVRWITLFFAKVTWEGRENVPAEGGCLIIANHASFADPTTVGMAVGRELHYLARRTLFRPPVMNWLLPLCNTMPIERERVDLRGMRAVIEKIRGGGSVLLFPEGTRSKDGNLQDPETGAAFIACKAQKPIVPARISGTFESWPRTRKWPKPGGHWHVVIGKPFLPPAATRLAKSEYEALARQMMSAIAVLPTRALGG